MSRTGGKTGQGNEASNTKSNSGDLKTTSLFNQKATNMQMASVEIYLNQRCHYTRIALRCRSGSPAWRRGVLHFEASTAHTRQRGLKTPAGFVCHTLPSSCTQSFHTNARLSPKREDSKNHNLKIALKLRKEKNIIMSYTNSNTLIWCRPRRAAHSSSSLSFS